MAFFAEYGFNKSHSAAYAYLAYQTAYLKTHYPVEFMTANLSVDMGDTDKVVKLINECRSMTIEILPPDINTSEREFRIFGNLVRFGLEAVKGVGSAAIEVMLKERQNGTFTSFDDFMKRVDNKRVNKKVIESLIKAGAFDSLYKGGLEASSDSLSASHEATPNRARAKAMETFSSPLRANGPGLFGDADSSDDMLQPWDEKTLLQYEKEALGFYISGHPLSRYRRMLNTLDVNRISDIADKEDRADICVAGIISDIKSKAREKGVTAFLSLEDETGTGDILVYPALYKELAPVLKKGSVVMVRGQVFRAEKGAKIMAREIQDVTDMEVSVKYEVSVK